MKKIKLLLISISFVINLTACRSYSDKLNNLSEMETISKIDNLENSENTNKKNTLSIEGLLFTIQRNHPHDNDRNMFYLFCVQRDGSAYSLNYSIEKDGVYNYDFIKKLYSCDNSVWGYADNIELLGSLSDFEIETLNNHVENINLNSNFYDRNIDDAGMAPDVEETINYTVYCYIPDGENMISFHVQSYGEHKGTSYKTHDENALSTMDIIKKTQYFKEWEACF
ncbi:MAG: hypothetical protein GX365_05250 [Clostridiales bacterium]|nr:hypothetical protein [Clostridiales bacterium]